MRQLIFCFLIWIPGLLHAQTDKEVLLGMNSAKAAISFCDSVLQTNYQLEIALIYLGILYDTDSVSKAEKYYQWLLTKETEMVDRMYLIAAKEVMSGNVDTSLYLIEEILAGFPEHLPTLILKARYFYKSNRIEELKKFVIPLVSKYPEIVEFQYYDAYISYAGDQLVIARIKTKKALLKAPSYFDLLRLNALIYVALKDYHGAYLTLLDLLKHYPKSYFGSQYMAGVLETLDSSKKALPYRKMALESAHAEISDAVLLMQTWYDLEEMDSVCYVISTTETRFPKDADTSLNAIEAWKFMERIKFSVCEAGTRRYYFQRGIAAYNLGKFNAADSLYRLAEAVEHSTCILPYFQGNRSLAQGRYEDAFRFYEQAFLAMDAYRVETGELYRDAIDPTYFFAEMYSRRSERLMTEGKFDSALIAAQYAVALAKNLDVDVLAGMRLQEALATLALGEISAARKLLYSIFEVSYTIEVDWCLKLCDYYECSKPEKIELKRFGLYNYYFVPAEFLRGKEVKCQRKLEGFIEEIEAFWKLAPAPATEYDMILGLLKEVTGQIGCDHFEKAALKLPDMNRIYLEKFGCR